MASSTTVMESLTVVSGSVTMVSESPTMAVEPFAMVREFRVRRFARLTGSVTGVGHLAGRASGTMPSRVRAVAGRSAQRTILSRGTLVCPKPAGEVATSKGVASCPAERFPPFS